MTNPFSNKSATTSAPASAPAHAAYNPFAAANEVEDRLPLMAADQTVKGRVIGYRITPKTPTSGTYVYVDLEVVEVLAGNLQVGAKVTHRLGGFESSGAAAAIRSLNELNFAIMPELKDKEGVDRSKLPSQMADSQEVLGREIFIRTTARATRTLDAATGRPRSIVKGEYHPAAKPA